MPGKASTLASKICREPDGPTFRLRSIHELTDGREDGVDCLIVPSEPLFNACLEFIESAREFFVGS